MDPIFLIGIGGGLAVVAMGTYVVNNLIRYNSNIKTLKDEYQKLVNKRNDLQQDVHAATGNGHVILSEVESWLTNVDNLIEGLRRFLEQDVEANSTRVNGCCPNLILRHSLSRKAKKKIKAIAELLGNGNFYRLSRANEPVIESNKEGTLKSSNREILTHSEVVSITSNFEDDNFIGEGGFGKVYRGTLNDTQVAVKKWSTSSRQGYKEFQAEAQMMVHHKNLVSLVGYCDEGDNKALIYEYMANGNLCQILSAAEASTKILSWEERLKIALDVARGLEYLHDGCREPIVHRDVKTSNILLNEKWEAKLSDFGLSRVFPTENASHVSTDPKGTNGYIDPEFNVTKILNKASDIYSFGVVLLELVTSRPAIITEQNSWIHISQWVNPLYRKRDTGSIVDPRLRGTYNTESAKKVLETAMNCLKFPATQRPEISLVCDELKESQKLQTDAERRQRMESEKTR